MVTGTNTSAPLRKEGSTSKKADLESIYNNCQKIYGTTKDGSFNACLHVNGYYQLKKEIEQEEAKND